MADLHSNKPAEVDAYMAELEHPLKAEAQALRVIIKGADPGITEQIKWKAPSFSFADYYVVTFNLRTVEHVHLVFHNEHIAEIDSDILEGTYRDRRMAYFTSMKDVRAKKAKLAHVIKEVIRLNS